MRSTSPDVEKRPQNIFCCAGRRGRQTVLGMYPRPSGADIGRLCEGKYARVGWVGGFKGRPSWRRHRGLPMLSLFFFLLLLLLLLLLRRRRRLLRDAAAAEAVCRVSIDPSRVARLPTSRAPRTVPELAIHRVRRFGSVSYRSDAFGIAHLSHCLVAVFACLFLSLPSL